MTFAVAMSCVTLCAAAICVMLYWAHRGGRLPAALDTSRQAPHSERAHNLGSSTTLLAPGATGEPRLPLLAAIWAAWLLGAMCGGATVAVACAVCVALTALALRSHRRGRSSRRLVRQTRALTRDLCMLAAGGDTALRCVHRAAERTAEPLREHLLAVVAAVQAGTSLHQAMSARAGLLRFAGYRDLLQVVWLHAETGASFASMLADCVSRDEEADLMWGELDAKMGESRWTALILALVPVAVMAYMVLFSPFSLRSMLRDQAGRYASAAAVALWLSGLVVCRRMQMPPADFAAER